jgi:hypothetical protein
MLAKTAFVSVACGVVTAVSLLACAGPVGKGEGDSCSKADDCSSDLTCQPVVGRSGDYCCPTQGPGAPLPKEVNCQPVPGAPH